MYDDENTDQGRRLSENDVLDLKFFIATQLPSLSEQTVKIWDYANYTQVCMKSVNASHAAYLLNMGSDPEFKQALKDYMGTDAEIESTYLIDYDIDLESIVLPPPAPPYAPSTSLNCASDGNATLKFGYLSVNCSTATEMFCKVSSVSNMCPVACGQAVACNQEGTLV